MQDQTQSQQGSSYLLAIVSETKTFIQRILIDQYFSPMFTAQKNDRTSNDPSRGTAFLTVNLPTHHCQIHKQN